MNNYFNRIITEGPEQARHPILR